MPQVVHLQDVLQNLPAKHMYLFPDGFVACFWDLIHINAYKVIFRFKGKCSAVLNGRQIEMVF